MRIAVSESLVLRACRLFSTVDERGRPQISEVQAEMGAMGCNRIDVYNYNGGLML